MIAEDVVDERHVLIGVRGALLEDDRRRRHAVVDRQRAHHLGFAKR